MRLILMCLFQVVGANISILNFEWLLLPVHYFLILHIQISKTNLTFLFQENLFFSVHRINLMSSFQHFLFHFFLSTFITIYSFTFRIFFSRGSFCYSQLCLLSFNPFFCRCAWRFLDNQGSHAYVKSFFMPLVQWSWSFHFSWSTEFHLHLFEIKANKSW